MGKTKQYMERRTQKTKTKEEQMNKPEPKNITQNIYGRLNSILQMICDMEHDYENQENKYIERRLRIGNDTFVPGTVIEMEAKLIKDSSVIRELRKDAQRLAMEHGVAEWWAKRNWDVIKNE